MHLEGRGVVGALAPRRRMKVRLSGLRRNYKAVLCWRATRCNNSSNQLVNGRCPTVTLQVSRQLRAEADDEVNQVRLAVNACDFDDAIFYVTCTANLMSLVIASFCIYRVQ